MSFKKLSELDKEILSAELFEIDVSGVQEEEHELIAFFEKITKEELSTKTKDLFSDYDYSIDCLESENWMENWKENFKAIEIGEDFIIKPTWEGRNDPSKICIDIDPKMAFGTGTHETTQLILEVLRDFLKEGDRVLDLGTGSGILAIAAEKLGASKVDAIDFDPIAIENCIENIELNRCKNIDASVGDIHAVHDRYDLLLANINRNVLLEISEGLIQKIKANGRLILSGLLKSDVEEIKEKYKTLTLIKSTSKGEWALLIFEN